MNKFIQWATLHLLVFFSPALFALGLGGAEVDSYLDRPLDVRVELISNSGEELQSVTVGLASAQDFELLGMSRAAIMVPLEFELVTDSTRPYIHITSELSVNEPVVQILVEVIWASGRMLREYTLFLDPPTFDSPAPPVNVNTAPGPAQMPAEQETTATVQRTPVTPEPQPQDEPEPVVEDSQQVSQSSKTSFADEEVYGPVAKGETLWGIARDFSRGSGYSINQAMLALQRKNPDAFIKNNINSLKRGAILRLPAISEISELSSREAMVEVLRQEEEKRTGVSSVAPEFNTPTVADIGDYQETAVEEEEPVVDEEDAGRLELVPPAEEAIPDAVSSDDLVTQGSNSEDLRDELSRTEEELVNVKQENLYLEQRIQELEAQVSEQQDQAMAVEDSDMAAMESKLAEDRASGEPEPPVAITPGGEAQPWYAGVTPLIIGGAVILIALIVWILRRRGAGQTKTVETGAVAALAAEAEEMQRNLDKKDAEAESVGQRAPVFETEAKPETEPEPEAETEPEPEAEPEAEPETEPEAQPESERKPEIVAESGPDPEQGALLDSGADLSTDAADDEAETVIEKASDSDNGFVIDYAGDEGQDQLSEDDPEVKLDLARAYLSLGDKEASKAMLDEVMKNGNDAQRAEAKLMLDEF